MGSEKSYVIAICDGSEFYLPNAEHIERNDDLLPWGVPDDTAAATAAEADGLRLIYGMDDVPDGIYIDTPKNREVILNALHEQNFHVEVQQNKANIFAHLPECTLAFYRLESGLGGKEENFAEWLRTSYELNSDFHNSPLEMATAICDAFEESRHQCGTDIARSLYDTMVVGLPNEIRSASRYLSLGGQMESLAGLAHAGFLMEDLNAYGHVDVMRVTQFMNGGGRAEDALDVLLSSCTKPCYGMPQQMV